MFMVINRWELLDGHEAQFQEGWSEIIQRNLLHYGGLGSRLHQADDGSWYSYSLWLSREHWEAAHQLNDSDQEARQKIIHSVKRHFPPVPLTPVLEHLLEGPDDDATVT
ncbi:MAG: antibiotic biosynthesis monooxygenase [Gammaproteobacteria bacterium]|nr:antibiotic biosynthesis monooxygenase [Gammaproteobacteria bacterium]